MNNITFWIFLFALFSIFYAFRDRRSTQIFSGLMIIQKVIGILMDVTAQNRNGKHNWPMSRTADDNFNLLNSSGGQEKKRRNGMYSFREKRHCPVFVFFFIVLVCSFSCVKGKKPPNVILIVVDTLRADHMSCYGYGRQTTPNIDSLSSNSIVFKNAISSAPWTAPAIGSLFTSQYPTVLGYKVQPTSLDGKFLTLAEVFKRNGYVTKGIVSHVMISSRLNFHQGFDSWDEDNAQGHGYVSSPSVTDKAISFLDENKDRKFFLLLHYFDPHYDLIQHEKYKYFSEYDGPLSGKPLLMEEIRNLIPTLSSIDIEYLMALYDSEISFMDEHMGRFFQKLKDMDMFEDAMIILTADHGEEFCEREVLWIGHTRTLYQELIHVPLIIKLPGMTHTEMSQDWVGHIDLMPTIVNYIGLNPLGNYDCQGEIINLANGRRSGRSALFSETRRLANLNAVIKNGWKLIVDTENMELKLFNLESDPGEMECQAETQKEYLSDLLKSLQEWYRHIDLQKKRFQLETEDPDFTDKQIEILKTLGYIR